MTKNQKVFLLIVSLYVIFDFVLGSIVGLYIWENTKSSRSILLYYTSIFASIAISSQFVGKLIEWIGAKRVYISSIIGGLFQTILLVTYGADIAKYIYIFGMLAGITISLQAMSYTFIVRSTTNNTNNVGFLGIKSSITNLVSLISVPLITGLIASSSSYKISYFIGFLVGIAILFLAHYLPTDSDIGADKESRVKLSDLINNYQVRSFLYTRIFYGIYGGPMWAILGVATLSFVGNLQTWGYISTGLTIISIISSYFFGRISEKSTHFMIVVTATLFYAFMAIVLATNWNMPLFLIYQVALALLNSSFSIHYEGLTYNTINNNPDLSRNATTILSLGELALGLGRILPLILLLVFQFSFDDPLVLSLLFVLISGIPLIILSSMSKSDVA